MARGIGRLRELAKQLDLYLCVGFSELADDQLYNTALLIGPDGKTAGKYRKTHGVEPFYRVGDSLPVFETRYGKVGIMICYDRQLPEIARTMAAQGAELILVPSNGMWGRMNDALLRTRCYENGVFLVFAHPRGRAHHRSRWTYHCGQYVHSRSRSWSADEYGYRGRRRLARSSRARH